MNLVNLIQAGTITASLLGGLLLYLTKPSEFKGIAGLLFLSALAASINILEESGLTRDIYLVSPVFIMLFGPVTYLAAKYIIDKKLPNQYYFHLFPALVVLFFTSFTSFVIAIGSVWRLAYAALTVIMLLNYMKGLDQQRSDVDEHSFHWLVWVLAVTAAFNFVDLIRLNLQPILPHELNLVGQGINNFVWLIAIMVMTIKLQLQRQPPKATPVAQDADIDDSKVSEYSSVFSEFDQMMVSNQWFLKPRLTLTELSELTGLQTRDISRAINLVANKTFNEYINQYRVEMVYQLLSHKPALPLIEVASQAGFSSKASFNKVFKQVSGMTPTEYKSHHKV